MSDQSLPRRFETPNAVMFTYASGELTGSELAVWRVEMQPGAAGPKHAVDSEQVLVVLRGSLELRMGDGRRTLEAQDSAVLAAGAERQLRNVSSELAVAMVSARAGARARTPGNEDVVIPWAA